MPAAFPFDRLTAFMVKLQARLNMQLTALPGATVKDFNIGYVPYDDNIFGRVVLTRFRQDWVMIVREHERVNF